jgi:hypothetical protein
MDELLYTKSKSGVRLWNDFRDNLVIDRYDPCLARMRASKRKHLKSENSEDALTWNAFRSLRQVNPSFWVKLLADRAFQASAGPSGTDDVTTSLWPFVPPPLALLSGGDEGDSEIDVVLEAPHWVWFIEAKYKSDASSGTTTRPDRDQILRNLDVGSHYAGVRRFYFSLLIGDSKQSRIGSSAVTKYSDRAALRAALGHRRDTLENIAAVGVLRWTDIAAVLHEASCNAPREDERHFPKIALAWLEEKGIKPMAAIARA